VESPAETARPAAPPFRRGNGERILLVDDEEPVIFLTQRVLRRLGYECEGYTDPASALKAFESRPTDFAAVITDLSMPRMTGAELIRRLRQVRESIPVVLTTGFIRPEDQAAAEKLGVRQLVLKPNTIDEMGRALADALQERPGVMGK
jgi:CheY-like chemotaxis protein